MMEKLQSLSRHMVGNRRRHRRRPLKYDTIVRDDIGRQIFRGYTTNLSQSGVKISGFVSGLGIAKGQHVRVEFLLLPRDCSRAASRAPVRGRVCRVDETDDAFTVAITFEVPLGA